MSACGGHGVGLQPDLGPAVLEEGVWVVGLVHGPRSGSGPVHSGPFRSVPGGVTHLVPLGHSEDARRVDARVSEGRAWARASRELRVGSALSTWGCEGCGPGPERVRGRGAERMSGRVIRVESAAAEGAPESHSINGPGCRPHDCNSAWAEAPPSRGRLFTGQRRGMCRRAGAGPGGACSVWPRAIGCDRSGGTGFPR